MVTGRPTHSPGGMIPVLGEEAIGRNCEGRREELSSEVLGTYMVKMIYTNNGCVPYKSYIS